VEFLSSSPTTPFSAGLRRTEYHRLQASFCTAKEQALSTLINFLSAAPQAIWVRHTIGNHKPTGCPRVRSTVRSFGVSDVVSFDFQHLFPNLDFQSSLYFNELRAGGRVL